ESLSLQRVSLEFGMNERYLSTFYREQFGENLQAHITRLRVEEANRLMRETDLPLSAIAERVGYVNPNTFRSAYNRIMGYNPSDYERGTNT
ncbi:MAG TPA: helix-turn-helix transcriptional regulator, partial [Clostridia bacterium]|nr:helix-turn-helix transcriptional regulator [Clostridia bacterium]